MRKLLMYMLLVLLSLSSVRVISGNTVSNLTVDERFDLLSDDLQKFYEFAVMNMV